MATKFHRKISQAVLPPGQVEEKCKQIYRYIWTEVLRI